MLRELKFVQGAVAKKDFIPAITHFAIENGTVRAFNGTIALCSPIKCDLNVRPKAIPMVQAIARCNDATMLSLTPGGRLSIRSGVFRELIECVDESPNHVEPEGEFIDFEGQPILDAIKALYPFVGTDASRMWTNGLLLRDESAFATNNVCLVEYWLNVRFPRVVNIPRAALAEMIRINEPPLNAQISDKSITFHYPDGRWIRSQLYDIQWPDMSKILNTEANPTPIPKELFEGLELLKPFVNKLGQIFISSSGLRTHSIEDEDHEGACFDMDWAHKESVFNHEMLALLDGIATSADFNLYPNPCLFYGERMRGAIIGMRL